MRKLFNKRFVALLLTLAMVLSLVPMMAFAADDEAPEVEGLVYDKTATLEADGTYTIDLSAYSTGTTTSSVVKTGVPLDIVLVLDQSGSMAYTSSSNDWASSKADSRYGKLQDALTTMMNAIADNAEEFGVEHRVAMIGFAGNKNGGGSNGSLCHNSADSNSSYWKNTGIFIDGKLKNYGNNTNGDVQLESTDYQKAMETIGTDGVVPADLTTAIGNVAANAGTYTQYGLIMAQAVFNNNARRSYVEDGVTKYSERIVIIFTDGDTDSDEGTCIGEAYKLKNDGEGGYGATVYTVSMLSSESTFLDYMSSNYPDLQNNPSANYVAVYDDGSISTSESYYVYTNGGYREVTYTSNTTTSYEPVDQSNMKTDGSETYYVTRSGMFGGTFYQEIEYNASKGEWGYYSGMFGSTWNAISASTTVYKGVETTTYGWYRNGTKYTPKTSSSDSSNTQFYKYEEVTSTSDKYYNNVTDMSKVTNIFTDIVKDATSSSTSVTLDANAYLQDVLNAGFVLPSDFAANTSKYVTVTTNAMTTTDDSNYTEGAATDTAKSLTVTALNNGVKVSGFDYSKKYVTKEQTGEILRVQIRGILPTDEAVTNAAIATNDATSGIFSSDATVSYSFPVPQTLLTSKIYVVDYAKPFTVNASDWNQDSITAVADEFEVVPATGNIFDYGVVTNTTSGITYTPNTMKWNGGDALYVFGYDEAVKTDASLGTKNANANGNIWSKVEVVPANNVYYEDSFAAIEYTGVGETAWEIVYNNNGSSDNNTEIPEGIEDSVHGWIDSLSDDPMFSDGSAHVISEGGAKASFTFVGTGVDIYSYTDSNSGIVTAMLYDVENPDTPVFEKYMIVDNLAVSGAYYQIPTLSFDELDASKSYRVDLYVNNAKVLDENGEPVKNEDGSFQYRSTYYLDGIRVYNPLGAVTDDYTGVDQNTIFEEVRDLLADTTNNADTSDDKVFIDMDGEGNVGDKAAYDASEYGTYGPKNEVYLAADQKITFKVSDTTAAYYVGLKAPEGTATQATVSNGAQNAVIDLAHSTDLYYSVKPTADGYVTIWNSGEALLSVTKIQMVTSNTAASAVDLLAITEVDAAAEFAAFSLRASAPYAEDEVVEPETPETEPEVPEIDVEIDNPDPEPEPTPDPREGLRNLVRKLFGFIIGLL